MKLHVAGPRRLLAYAFLLPLWGCAGTAGTPAGSGAGDAAGVDAAAAIEAEAVDPAVALEEAKKTAADRPDDMSALFALGVAWQRRAEAVGDATGKAYLDSARVVFDQVLERDPRNVKALVHSGLVLEDLGQNNEALLRYNKATEVAPQDPRPYVNLGALLYFKFKRTHDAKEALVKALELDPDNADAHFNLGVLFADATLYREARVEWERVAAGPPGPARELAEQNLEKIRPLLTAQDAAAAGEPPPSP